MPNYHGRGRVPLGLLGMLALIVLTELALASQQPAFVNAWSCDWRYSASAASWSEDVRNAGILCVGDSLAKFGIVPQVLEERLGVSAYNLAVSAGSPPASFFLLRRAFEAGARPRAVLFECSPHTLAITPAFTRVLMPELARINEVFDLAITGRDPELFGVILTAKLLNSIKDRLEIRAWARARLTNGKDSARSRRAFRAVFERNRLVNHGSELQRHRPRPQDGWDELRPTFSPDSWLMTPEMRSYVTRLFELTAAEGVPVYWVIPPFRPELHALRDQKGLETRLTSAITELQGRFPHVSVLDARCSGYDEDVFVDAIHLDTHGAAALSHQVADALDSGLKPTARGGPSWVTLATAHRREIPAAVEDMDTSREALRLAWQNRNPRR